MKIIIGSDHRGYALKEQIKKKFTAIEWDDVGTNNSDDRFDYPIVAKKVCEKILAQEAERGLLICGSGVGVSIAANRFPKIYAALCWSPAVAKIAREHDRANVLALSSDFIEFEKAAATVQAWLDAQFAGGRYQRRLDMID